MAGSPALPWGFEVRLPEGFKLTAAEFGALRAVLLFRRARGRRAPTAAALPKDGEAELLIPAGLKGPIFLVTTNFRTIKTYNNSTAYALGVALLGDAVIGPRRTFDGWPTRDKPLAESRGARAADATRQSAAMTSATSTGGSATVCRRRCATTRNRSALAPDGYPTLALLRRLRRRAEGLALAPVFRRIRPLA